MGDSMASDWGGWGLAARARCSWGARVFWEASNSWRPWRWVSHFTSKLASQTTAKHHQTTFKFNTVQYYIYLHTFTRYSSFHSSREPGSCFSWEAMGCALQLFREIVGERICHKWLPLTSKISQETQEIARETQPLGSSCPWALRDWSWAQIPTVSRGLPVHQAKPTKAPSIWCQGEPDLHTKWAKTFCYHRAPDFVFSWFLDTQSCVMSLCPSCDLLLPRVAQLPKFRNLLLSKIPRHAKLWHPHPLTLLLYVLCWHMLTCILIFTRCCPGSPGVIFDRSQGFAGGRDRKDLMAKPQHWFHAKGTTQVHPKYCKVIIG